MCGPVPDCATSAFATAVQLSRAQRVAHAARSPSFGAPSHHVAHVGVGVVVVGIGAVAVGGDGGGGGGGDGLGLLYGLP